MSNKEKYYNAVKKNLDKAVSTLGQYFDVYVNKGNSIEVRFNSEFNDSRKNPRYAFNFNKYGRYIIRRHFDGFCHPIGMKYAYHYNKYNRTYKRTPDWKRSGWKTFDEALNYFFNVYVPNFSINLINEYNKTYEYR